MPRLCCSTATLLLLAAMAVLLAPERPAVVSAASRQPSSIPGGNLVQPNRGAALSSSFFSRFWRKRHPARPHAAEILSPLSYWKPLPDRTAGVTGSSSGSGNEDITVELAVRQQEQLRSSSDASLTDPHVATFFAPSAVRYLPRLADKGIAKPAVLPPLVDDYSDSSKEDANDDDDGGGGGDSPYDRFNITRVVLFARLSAMAYCNRAELMVDWTCDRCKLVPEFTTEAVIHDVLWNLVAFVGYHAPTKSIVCSFKGTDSSSWGNWIENLRTWRMDHMYPVPQAPHALIHTGFYSVWAESSLKANVTAAVASLLAKHPGATLVSVGHSMGGAVAQLCALDMKFEFDGQIPLVNVYTFGSPRVGNLAYKELFNSFVNESWRFTHNRDAVPSVPLLLQGFHHVAREVWEVDVAAPSGLEMKLLMCDGSGEDPSCHDSACYLGLCTSVADHLTYLGIPMYQDGPNC